MPKRKLNKRQLIKKCDKLFSEVVRSIGECEHCGAKDKTLHCAHIISRAYRSTRWNLENAVCLCTRCHLYWAHKNPVEFVDWLEEYYGEDIRQRLRQEAQKIELVDLEETYKYLTSLAKRG